MNSVDVLSSDRRIWKEYSQNALWSDSNRQNLIEIDRRLQAVQSDITFL